MSTLFHRLGTILPSGCSIDDAIAKIPDLHLGVAAYPMTVSAGPARGMTCDSKAVVRDDGVKVGEVGRGFEVVQASEIFRQFRPWVEGGAIDLECGGSIMGGSRVFLMGKLRDGSIDVGKGDVVEGHILFAHAHDGSLSIRYGLHAGRVACWNQLAAPAWRRDGSRETQAIIRHTRSVHERIAQHTAAIQGAIAGLKIAAERWRHMAATPVRPTDAMLRAYMIGVFGKNEAEAQRRAVEEKRESPRMDAVRTLLERGQGADLPTARGTAWGLYNAVTEYLTHVQGRADGRKGDEQRANRNAFGDGASALVRAEQICMQADRFSSLADLVQLGHVSKTDAATATAA